MTHRRQDFVWRNKLGFYLVITNISGWHENEIQYDWSANIDKAYVGRTLPSSIVEKCQLTPYLMETIIINELVDESVEPVTLALLRKALKEATHFIDYLKPDKYDDEEHEQVFNEQQTKRFQLLEATKDLPEFQFPNPYTRLYDRFSELVEDDCIDWGSEEQHQSTLVLFVECLRELEKYNKENEHANR